MKFFWKYILRSPLKQGIQNITKISQYDIIIINIIVVDNYFVTFSEVAVVPALYMELITVFGIASTNFPYLSSGLFLPILCALGIYMPRSFCNYTY